MLPDVDPPSASRIGGLSQDPIRNEVLVEDSIVSCLKCEKTIHTSGKTDVKRISYRITKKSLKLMWFNSTGKEFNKVSLHSLATALRIRYCSEETAVGSLLDGCYEDFCSMMTLKAANRSCTVLSTQWTNGSDSLDAPYFDSDIKCVMAKLPFVTVAAVVTDNTATTFLVWSKLVQKCPEVLFLLCIFNALHLVVKYLVQSLPWSGKLDENSCKLVRFVASQLLWFDLKRLLHMEGISALVLPADTRWNLLKMLRSIN
ncbi:hypothetical protein F442_01115 [Phytophthora nicotianae P10297]|uniref:DUF659 domain-containing protein n=1 Tax=Phytophthora nicotianae P10297 TaxID=1317064 RepID=W3A3A6_PHYNI|nr:hypothetical protein F442_01115 [Phytophthora nicotianae P10297]